MLERSATVSEASLAGRAVIPSRLSVSSRDIGWTSVLLEVHTGVARADSYASVPTPDQIIGVAMSGRYASELFDRGVWRRGVYDAGAICVHTPGESRRYRFPMPEPADADFKTAMLYLPQAQMAAAADHVRRIGRHSGAVSLTAAVGHDPVIVQVTSALVRAMDDAQDDLYAETAAAWLTVHLLTRYSSLAGVDDRRRPGVITDTRLARVIEFMSAHFAEPLTLDRLADEACVSKYHFARLFRSKVGRSPLAFLADLRLDAACRMLVTSDLPVAAVGAACGYRAPSHFSAVFAARYGLPPHAYRASYQTYRRT